MFEYIKGLLTHTSPEAFVIEVHGIGYKLLVPINLYTSTYKEGTEVCLYTSFVVREDAHRLFGFAARADRDLFEKLLGITGIGVKTALSIIGHMTQSELKSAIQTENIVQLTRIPGIGKKSAERIIVELSDRIHKWKEPVGKEAVTAPLGATFDALSALINLGYNHAHAQKAVQKALDQGTSEEHLPLLITAALRHL